LGLIIGGALMHPANVGVIVAGGLFLLFGLIFLIVSFATHGAAD
jgi:hypothetical protein